MQGQITWALIGVKALRGRFVGQIPMDRPLARQAICSHLTIRPGLNCRVVG